VEAAVEGLVLPGHNEHPEVVGGVDGVVKEADSGGVRTHILLGNLQLGLIFTAQLGHANIPLVRQRH